MAEKTNPVDEYRRKARRAEQKAKECRDAETRRIYVDLVRHWRRKAKQAERRGRAVWRG
jgi:hypothetical protein